MKFDPERRRRRSIRLRGYDYTQTGAYFVTICTHGRACLFGKIVDREMQPNAYGEMVREQWFRSAELRRDIRLYPDEFVVMPNHIHGIIRIRDVGRTDTDGVDVDGMDTGVGAQRRCAPTNDTGDVDGANDANGVNTNVGAQRRCAPTDDTGDIDGVDGANDANDADTDVGAQRRCAPTGAPTGAPTDDTGNTDNIGNTAGATPIPVAPGSLAAVVRAFKSAVTKHINLRRGTPGGRVWQRNYHEHIIRNEASLQRIRDYIAANPARWTDDREHPRRQGRSA